eukprot:365458-Chlamydomonas_euryale.AAC.10
MARWEALCVKLPLLRSESMQTGCGEGGMRWGLCCRYFRSSSAACPPAAGMHAAQHTNSRPASRRWCVRDGQP